ncbi:MAG: hypothetical protein LH679_09380, partial [Cyanobacteria bacterium CAN_BIN43]|nr:hypothetical protein [Cyanobacteria bacterium CAN_BIN43]
MTRQSFLLFLKKRSWVALPLLAILTIGSVLWGQRTQNTPLTTTLNPAPLASPQPSETLPALVKPPSPAALSSPVPSLTPSVTKTSAPSSTAAVDPTALTAAERALNEAAKQRITGSGVASVDALVEMRVAIAEGVPALSLTITQSAVLVDAQTGSQIQELSG